MTLPPAAPRAFTLIEILVATSVLALLALLVLQIVGVSSSLMSASSRKIDGLSGARFALDRLGSDLATRVKRADVGLDFQKLPGNDTLSFFSAVAAYSGDRRIAGVGYRIQESDPARAYQLERGVAGLEWNGDFPRTAPSLNTLEYDVLAEGVLRLEFGYLMRDGRMVTDLSLTDLKSVSAVVVAIAVLDAKSRLILTESQLRELAESLSDPVPADGRSLISGWEEKLLQSSLPRPVIQQVRFFERYYDVH